MAVSEYQWQQAIKVGIHVNRWSTHEKPATKKTKNNFAVLCHAAPCHALLCHREIASGLSWEIII